MLWRAVGYAMSSGLALAPGTGPAPAADVPGNSHTAVVLKPGRLFDGFSDFRRDSDWYRITLAAKTHYAFNFLSSAEFTELNFRDAAGHVLTSSGHGFDFETDGGFEFQTKAAGTYFLEAKDASSAGESYPIDYTIIFGRDCRGDFLTTCTLRPGQTRRRAMNYSGDVDDFRTDLSSQRSYSISLVSELGKTDLILIDRQQHLFASLGSHSSDPTVQSGIKVPKSGTYHVVVFTEEDNAFYPYTLRLTSP